MIEALPVTITRRFSFDAAHRVSQHEGKCSSLHGHRYDVDVTVVQRAGGLDLVGRVVDFGVLKHVVGGFLDEHFDHTTLVFEKDEELLAFLASELNRGKRSARVFDCEPTAENIAKDIADQAQRLLDPHGLDVVFVTVWETEKSSATWRRSP